MKPKDLFICINYYICHRYEENYLGTLNLDFLDYYLFRTRNIFYIFMEMIMYVHKMLEVSLFLWIFVLARK